MPERKELQMMVRDARYYPEQRSMVIVGEEVQSRRPITHQMLVKDFVEAYGLTVSLDDHDAWRSLAEQLRKRRDPFKLVFLGEGPRPQEILPDAN